MEHTIAALLEKIAEARVLVVGDVMLDHYVEGTVARISPEAPVPVMALEREYWMPGGAANVAANISALGAAAYLVGVIGDDGAGQKLTAAIEADHGIESRLLKSPGRRTTTKTRMISRQHLLRVDDEIELPLNAGVHDGIMGYVRQGLQRAGAMVLSDYGKGMFLGEWDDGGTLAHRLMEAAAEAGVPVLVDTKNTDAYLFGGAMILKPNLAELAAVTDMPVGTDAEIETAARFLIDSECAQYVVVTRGRDGASVIGEDLAEHLPGSLSDVFDVSGAGDTFMAALAAACATGAAVQEAAALATSASGIVVGKVGTGVVTPEEILSVSDLPVYFHATDPEIDDMIRMWRRRGLTIGFTNGVFDLLHIDHVDFLRRCRQRCDRLVVGLNSDASVKALKGEGRPVVPEQERAELLLTLDCVHLVAIFDGATPQALIRRIEPDVLIKDSGYTPEEVAGADDVRGWGGHVAIIPRGTRTSTTERVETLRTGVTKTLDAAPVAQDEAQAVPAAREATVYDHARQWLYNGVLPWWFKRGFDEEFCVFRESFKWRDYVRNIDQLNESYRVMVQARQLAVFSDSGNPVNSEAVLQPFMHPDGGWKHSTSDDTRILYDHAFVMFAAAYTPGTMPRARIVKHTMPIIENGDWSAPRKQEDYMHLLEAYIALYEATQDSAWLDNAEKMTELAQEKFIRDGMLYETFDKDWNPAVDPNSFKHHISPGHHFEWVWLLHQMHRLTGRPGYLATAGKLFSIGMQGINTDSASVCYVMSPKGYLLDARRRLWPQCEALRAVHSMIRHHPEYTGLPGLREKILTTIMRDHAAGPVWHEWLAPDGDPLDNRVPASSLYHLYFCLKPVLEDMKS